MAHFARLAGNEMPCSLGDSWWMRPIVAIGARAQGLAMVKWSRLPGYCCVAAVASVGRGHMRCCLANCGKVRTTVTGEARADCGRVIEYTHRCPRHARLVAGITIIRSAEMCGAFA